MIRRKNIQHFNEYTTCHGFLELYYSKSIFWKTIWSLSLITAIGLTGVQLYKTAKNAVDQPTSTVIEQFDGDPMLPPLSICYPFFVYWVDFELATKLGFDRKSVLYGMSFIIPVVSLSPYNEDESRSTFEYLMKKNGFQNVKQFIDTVSYEKPPGFHSETVKIRKWRKIFHPTSGLFCYIAESDAIRNSFNHTFPDDKILRFYYNPSYFQLNPSFVSEEEYGVYVIQTFKKFAIANVTYHRFTLSPTLGFNCYRDSYFILPNNAWRIDVTITSNVYNWLYDDNRPCKTDNDYFTFDNCKVICKWKEYHRQNPDQCLDIQRAFVVDPNLTMVNLCMSDVHTSVASFNSLDGNVVHQKDINYTTPFYIECTDEYCMVPCEQWKFTSIINVIQMPLEMTSFNVHIIISVDYPTPSSIFAVTEIKSNSLESLLADVGGIISLWLGASFLSVLQLVYWVCCSGCDETCAESTKCRKTKFEMKF